MGASPSGMTVGSVFPVDGQGNPQYSSDYLITRSAPSARTGKISVIANGLGTMSPTPLDGKVTAVAAAAVNQTTATVNGSTCAVNFAGLIQGAVALGRVDIDLSTCSPTLTAGNWPLVIYVNGTASQPVELAVR